MAEVLDLESLLNEALQADLSSPFPEPVILTIPEVVRFATRGVAPPSNLYVRKEDRVVIQVRNSVTAAEIVVSGRMVTIAGVVRPFQRIIIPSTDRSPDSTFIDVGEGFLLNISVFTQAVNVLRGQCFVLGLYIAGETTTNQTTAVILSDYVYTDYVVSYPFGTLKGPDSGRGTPRTITGTNPAAGSEVTETVPTRARWRLLSFAVQLVASGAAANRVVNLFVTDGVTNGILVPSATFHIANETRRYNYIQSGAQYADPNGNFVLPLPGNLPMKAGATFGTATNGLQAGDNYDAPLYTVEEWIEN